MKPEKFESTYALLLRSEEKERNVFETAVYLLLIATMAFSYWQATSQRVTIPTRFVTNSFAQSAPAHPRSV